VELLVLALLERAEDGVTAEEDPEVVPERGPISWILGCAVSTGLRSTGTDDEEVAAINMAHTSGKETTKEVIGWIAMSKTAEAPNLCPLPPERFLNSAREPFWFSW
jgi:hypothetical protein